MRASLAPGCILLAFSLAAPASAGFFECKDETGRVMFQDRPCAAGQESTEREEPRAGITRASEEAVPAALGEVPEAPERPLTTRIEAPARVPANQRHVVVHSETEGSAWQEMLGSARATHGHGTLVRVFLEHAMESDLIQAKADRIANPDRVEGAGRYREFPSGTFLLVTHTENSTGTGKEALELGNPRHGVSTIWLPVAPSNSIAVGGDIVLGRMAMSQRGQLEVRLPPGFRIGPLAVGPLVVGGSYGQQFECDTNGACRAGELAPGPYKIQFPGIDAKRARFDADVEPGKRQILEFRPGSAKKIMIVERRQVALASE